MKAEREARNHVEPSGNGAGRWVVPQVSYISPERRFCAYCGRPIARQYWVASTGNGDDVFCGPDHADRYSAGAAGRK